MTIEDLLKYCEIRLNYLYKIRNTYIELSDLDSLAKTDAEIDQTITTINNMKSLM